MTTGLRRRVQGTRAPAPTETQGDMTDDFTELPDDAQDTAAAGDAPRRTAVVAEDESLIRMDIVETLTEAGFDVIAAVGDGESAIEKTRELRPDVVILDVKMPQTDGVTAAEKIGEENLAPVVMLTAFSQTELVERARDAGAMAYVVKPFTPADLLPAVEIAVSRHQRIGQLGAESAVLGARLEARKRVDRAKGLLQTNMGLSEPDAFRWIQKTSMDRRLTMREVADAVVDQLGGQGKD